MLVISGLWVYQAIVRSNNVDTSHSQVFLWVFTLSHDPTAKSICLHSWQANLRFACKGIPLSNELNTLFNMCIIVYPSLQKWRQIMKSVWWRIVCLNLYYIQIENNGFGFTFTFVLYFLWYPLSCISSHCFRFFFSYILYSLWYFIIIRELSVCQSQYYNIISL